MEAVVGVLVVIVALIALWLGWITIGTLTALIPLVVIGLIIGAVARLVVPGHQLIGIGATILCGIAGAIVGGVIALQVLHVAGLLALVVQVACAAALIALLARRSTPRYTVIR